MSRVRPIAANRSVERRWPWICSGMLAGERFPGMPETGVTRAIEKTQGSPSKSASSVPAAVASSSSVCSIRLSDAICAGGSGEAMPSRGEPGSQPKLVPPMRGTKTIMSSVPISAAALPMLL